MRADVPSPHRPESLDPTQNAEGRRPPCRGATPFVLCAGADGAAVVDLSPPHRLNVHMAAWRARSRRRGRYGCVSEGCPGSWHPLVIRPIQSRRKVGASMHRRLVKSLATMMGAAALVVAPIALLAPAAHAEVLDTPDATVPFSAAANQPDFWEEWLETERGITGATCFDEPVSGNDAEFTLPAPDPGTSYVLAVTKAGSQVNWVFFDPKAGDVVTAVDEKDISTSSCAPSQRPRSRRPTTSRRPLSRRPPSRRPPSRRPPSPRSSRRTAWLTPVPPPPSACSPPVR